MNEKNKPNKQNKTNKTNKSNKSNKTNKPTKINNKVLLEFEKIKEKSTLIFKNLIKLLNNPKTDSTIKKSFYYFLFSDTINIKNDKDFNEINIIDIIENNQDIIDEYFDNSLNKIGNNNINIIDKFKKILLEKKKEIKNKLKECNDHLLILNNVYSNIITEKLIPIKLILYKHIK